MFFGTPHAGSAVDQQKRMQLLQALGTLFRTKAPKNLTEALKENSKELAELSDAFEALDIFKTLRLKVTSYYESTTPKFSKAVRPSYPNFDYAKRAYSWYRLYPSGLSIFTIQDRKWSRSGQITLEW